MSIKSEAIYTTIDEGPWGRRETREHPAFATINASRLQGRFDLFGSNIPHQGAVQIEITGASLVFEGGRERVSEAPVSLVKLYMSEAQWAAFVSRQNQGLGTPCTLRRAPQGVAERVPSLPPPESSAARLDSAAQALLDESQRKQVEAFDKMKSILDGAKVPAKLKRELLEQIHMAYDHGQENRDYHRKVLIETSEKLVADAKTEIDATVNDIVQRLGLSSLREAAALPAGEADRPALEG